MEKFKIVSNEKGNSAEIFIDGKKITRVTDARVSVLQGYVLRLEITRWKTDENGAVILNDDRTEILSETFCYDFGMDFSQYMNPPEDGD